MKRVIDRPVLKERAKNVLRRYYWLLFVVSLIVAMAAGGSNAGNAGTNRGSTFVPMPFNTPVNFLHWSWGPNMPTINVGNTVIMGPGGFNFNNLRNFEAGNLVDVPRHITNTVNSAASSISSFVYIPGWIVNLVLLGVGLLIGIIGIAAIGFRIFVAYPLMVGGKKMFISSADGETKPEFRDLLLALRSGRYLNIVLAGFLTGLYTFLWTLLFVIPGIVKFYSYRLTPYILAENPELRASEAIALSMDMTRGHKMDLFVMDLSFIGWRILGAMAFGIGIIFVNPYVDATFAQAYLALRDNAIEHRADIADLYRHSGERPMEKREVPRNPGGNGPAPKDDDVLDYRDKPYEDT